MPRTVNFTTLTGSAFRSGIATELAAAYARGNALTSSDIIGTINYNKVEPFFCQVPFHFSAPIRVVRPNAPISEVETLTEDRYLSHPIKLTPTDGYPGRFQLLHSFVLPAFEYGKTVRWVFRSGYVIPGATVRGITAGGDMLVESIRTLEQQQEIEDTAYSAVNLSPGWSGPLVGLYESEYSDSEQSDKLNMASAVPFFEPTKLISMQTARNLRPFAVDNPAGDHYLTTSLDRFGIARLTRSESEEDFSKQRTNARIHVVFDWGSRDIGSIDGYNDTNLSMIYGNRLCNFSGCLNFIAEPAE